MLFWSRKPAGPEFRPVTLPGEVGTISLPSALTVEMEDDETLMAYPDPGNFITLRFSSISIVKKGSDDKPVAETHIRNKAAEQGYQYVQAGKHGVAVTQEESEQDGHLLLIKYWYVGSKNTVVIVSATILKSSLKSALVRQTLEHMPRILESLEITKSHHVIVSGDNEIEFTEQVVDPAPQETRPFAAAEDAWLEEADRHSRELSIQYGSGGELDPEELDRIFSRWMNEPGEKESDEIVANSLGAAFGSYLVEHHGFQWIVVTDEYGTEYAVRHDLNHTIAFPRASVQKRIENGQAEFFNHVFLIILDQVRRAEID